MTTDPPLDLATPRPEGAEPASPGHPGGEEGAVSSGIWRAIQERLAAVTTPRYQVGQILGFGGMAGVYLAEEPRLGRRVAIKVMAPMLMADGSLVARFQQEARTTAQLAHPNIVTIFDVDAKDDLQYFVMEYVAGRSLGQVLRTRVESVIPIDVARHWIAQVASALTYAHRAGVVHRDVKPGNILIDAHGNARVTDFGIAKVADQPGLTRTGFLVGTPSYMSPEQCGSGPITGASDQYALGIVAYELLAGRPPFIGETMSVVQAHLSAPPPPLESFRTPCPPDVVSAIERMLAKSPEDRFPTAAAAAAAMGAFPFPDEHPLRGLAIELGGGTRPSATFEPAPRTPAPPTTTGSVPDPGQGVGDASRGANAGARTGRRAGHLALAAGVMAAVVIGGVSLFRGGAPQSVEPAAQGPAPTPTPPIAAAEEASPAAPAVASTVNGESGAADPRPQGSRPGATAGAASAVPSTANPAPATPTAEVAAPLLGQILIVGNLPSGARIVLRDASGERAVEGRAVSLSPGTYRLEASAPGFTTVGADLRVEAGQSSTWTPSLAAVPVVVATPQPAPVETIDRAAVAAQVRSVIDAFVRGLERRDVNALVVAFPGAVGTWESRWRAFYENGRDVRDLQAQVQAVGAFDVTGTTARTSFSVAVEFTDAGGRQRPVFQFTATFRRTGETWTLTELTQSG